ncbi:BamA/TamA family outer membrane protein [Bacteroidota bacterium]
MKKLIIILLFSPLWILLFSSQSFSQNIKIQSIRFEGIKKNKSSYLQKNIQVMVGDSIDTSMLAKDIQNLNALPSVANTDYTLDTLDNDIHLVFYIEEAITAFPIFNIGLIEENIWFKVGYGSFNLFGLGHQINAGYQYSDDRHDFFFFYRLPYWGRSNWGSAISLSKYASEEPLFFNEGTVNYEYEIRSAEITTSYSFTPSHIAEFSFAYFTENYRQSSEQELVAPPGPVALDESKLLLKLNHHFRKLRYHYYMINGWENRFTIQEVFNFHDGSQFISFTDQLSMFKIIGKRTNLAARFRFGIASNKNSPFAPYVLDSYVNIRGVGNRVDRGTAMATLNLELRYRIFDIKNIASQIVMFSDQGNWRNPGGKIEELIQGEKYRHFIGGGIRLIYRKGYNYVLRVDYGFDTNDFRERGFVLGVGQYF